jgi:hypothetical protein
MPVYQLRPEVPRRVAAIVAKMMAKHPKNRIQTAADVVRYLSPLAERKETRFNYRSVLASRLSYAKKRLASQKAKASAQAPTPRLPKEAPPASTSAGSRQSTIETIVREDTRLDQPRRQDTPPSGQ